ncbi:succinate dehydrogenase/fumarate reductase iron-sulfur subunit [Egibacter rhizosphaerae]|uniref:Succinate dehydrogenase/fumarate reductase iron-sulfur subunit n=1 Tax=Egibacter rhizosphaerae TaxID=1670831 RepID=A0A411YHP9_9ACTN|nr:succinate dehydrogenase/fumarate reductase iron-sulfur subunit [Egibacter rhizosphaerae]QBI20639.1 succinate dehydrogenase/fumarate reductase iron-sulfur subunit [Egibacter rhizosphaerae]
MDLTLKVWRQPGPEAEGRFETYQAKGIDEHASFLEMLDLVNEQLTEEGIEPIAFDSDCREGICGTCGVMVDGEAHGPVENASVCQVHMFNYSDGDTITIEPWRAAGFPIQKDLIVDRTAFDEIIAAGGYITVPTGSAPEANLTPVDKPIADTAFEAAQCIGCGACVAACPNGAAQLFTAAKVSHLNLLPQGQPERYERVVNMVEVMEEYFGSCTNHGECQDACPKDISIDFIAWLNKDYRKASFKQMRAS